MNFFRRFLIGLFLIVAGTASSEKAIQLTFEPESEEFRAATKEYEAIWTLDGDRIIQAMEKHTGLKFNESQIRVIVFEGMSSSGFRNIPMRMRASYPSDTKKATLIHELGHRLEGRFFKKDEDDHQYLFLYLYDVWLDLYGKEFADEQVRIESERRGHFDYESVWKQTLSMTAQERKIKWQDFVKSRIESTTD
jgi:hypothetical protein